MQHRMPPDPVKGDGNPIQGLLPCTRTISNTRSPSLGGNWEILIHKGRVGVAKLLINTEFNRKGLKRLENDDFCFIR